MARPLAEPPTVPGEFHPFIALLSRFVTLRFESGEGYQIR